jgi:hypothetical protein
MSKDMKYMFYDLDHSHFKILAIKHLCLFLRALLIFRSHCRKNVTSSSSAKADNFASETGRVGVVEMRTRKTMRTGHEQAFHRAGNVMQL